MKRTHKLLSGALCLAALGLLFAADAARALDKERKIVRKVEIKCEEGDCEHHAEHQGHGDGSVAWFSGDGPMRFAFAIGGGYLGVQLSELTPELRLHFGVGEDEGVMVSKIMEDSPALRAGLEVGDIITAVDGKTVSSTFGLGRAIRGKEDGESVLLEVWRDGAVQNLTAAVEERERTTHGMHHAFAFDCEDDDCGPHHRLLGHGLDIDCDEGPCQIKVQCDDEGECVCTVDGEETDCGELHVGDD